MGLLILLLLCHYLGDYQLTTGRMLAAKAEGKQLLPILEHASVHATLMLGVLLLFAVPWTLALACFALELGTHFLIDVAKGRLTARYVALRDVHNKAYWQVYGLDQLLHTLVVLLIYHLVQG